MAKTHIPQAIRRKGNALIAQLNSGTSPFLYGGKRLKFVSPSLVSIPIGSYRLLCEYRYKWSLKSTKLMHHGAYEDFLYRYSKK